MRLRSQLFLSFAAVSLSTLLVGAVAIASVREAEAQFGALSEEAAGGIVVLGDLRASSLRFVASTNELGVILASGGAPDGEGALEELELIERARDDLLAATERYGAQADSRSPQEQELVRGLTRTVPGFLESGDELVAAILAKEGDETAEAKESFESHEQALLLLAHDAIEFKRAQIEAEEAALQAAFSRLTRAVVIGVVSALAASLALGALLSGRIATPLARLRDHAQLVGDGRFDAPPPRAPSRDEVGELTDAIASMTMKLKRSRDDLDDMHAKTLRNERLSALGTLVAGVAHEINNPLAYIRGNIELAQMTLDESKSAPHDAASAESVKESLTVSLAGLDRIEHIVRGLKAVARSSMGEPQPTDVNALVERAIAVAAPRFDPRVVVERDLAAASHPRALEGDLAQALLNVLLNAAESIGPEPGVIRIRTRDARDAVVIEVDDTGPGIPASVLPRLFTPFVTTKPTGTGLGLGISQRILRDHGGAIEGENLPGRGARFRLTIPLRGRPLPAFSPAHSM